MIEIFHYGFMQNALLAGAIASVLCGVVGIYVILNRLVFIGGGIAHSAFGGIGLGYLLGANPLVYAILFSLATALGIGALSDRSKVSEDTAIGVFWAVGMSLGIVFISLSPGRAPDLFDYLFGNILAVSSFDILIISALTLGMILLVALLYKELLILSFDPLYGEAVGLPVFRLRLLLLSMVALSVVVLIKIVGIILVIALLTIPGAIGRQRAKSLKGIMLLSILLGISFVSVGLLASYHLNTPSGATIILAAAATFFLSTILSR